MAEPPTGPPAAHGKLKKSPADPGTGNILDDFCIKHSKHKKLGKVRVVYNLPLLEVMAIVLVVEVVLVVVAVLMLVEVVYVNWKPARVTLPSVLPP